MNNLKKKIVSAVTVLTVITMMMPGLAMGATAEELQAQINNLLASLSALQAQLATLQGTTPATTYTGIPAGFTFTKNLSQGMTDPDVVNLKGVLAAKGCVTGLSNNQYFGSLTLAGVKCFQNKYKTEISALAGYTISASGFVGAGTRAQLNALLAGGPVTGCTTNTDCAAGYTCTAGTCVVTPVGVPMTVALAIDNPAAANLQKGTANNSVLKITLTGSATIDTYVTGLTIKQYGNAADASVPAVKVFDENNIQVGTNRTVIGGISNFVFVPALLVSKNTTRTITVAVNILAGAETLTTVQMGVDAATGVSGATFTGTFPVKGNVFTIVPAGTLGTLTLGDYSTPALTSVKIGVKDVVLESVILSAGSREDVLVNQMTVTNAGTISDSDITNVRIREVGGAVVAGPVNLANKKATLNFISGVLLTKGTSKKFEVIADIAAGNTRTIAVSIAAGAVIGIGQTSGVNIVNTGASTATTITIGVGALVVSQSTSHPSGTAGSFIKTTSSKTIGVFSVRAVGENVIVNTIDLKFVGGTALSGSNYLSSVGLYDGDTLISDLKDTVTAQTAQQFTLNWTIPADTVKTLNVKAITNNLTITTSEALTITWDVSTGYGLSSGESVNTTAAVSLTAITVYPAGTFTAAYDTLQTPLNQGVLYPLSDVLLGSIKFRPTREDMRLKTLILNAAGAATSEVASLTLYDSDGTTQLSYPETVSTGGTFSFVRGTNLLQDVIFTKDAYKTLFVKGNPTAAFSNYYLQTVTGDTDLILTGLDSTADATTTALDLGNSVQGEFTFSAVVLEVKKNATSPSGTPARGTTQTYAIWDIFNPTSADRTITSITLTSRTGLPSDIPATSTTMFRLVDEYDTVVAAQASTTSYAAGTITFDATVLTGNALTIPAGSSKSLKLQINTTNSTIWDLGTQMQWTVAAAGDMTVTSGTIGWAGSIWSVRADTNVVSVP